MGIMGHHGGLESVIWGDVGSRERHFGAIRGQGTSLGHWAGRGVDGGLTRVNGGHSG